MSSCDFCVKWPWLLLIMIITYRAEASCSITATGSGQPSDPRLLSGFNDILGPVITLTYNDSGLLLGVNKLYTGALRHPGGGVANYWSLKNASYTQPCNTSNYNHCSEQAKVEKLPPQTFSPSNFFKGVGSSGVSSLDKLPNMHSISYVLNLLTLNETEMFHQIDVLKAEIPINSLQYMELGNEFYNPKYAWRFPNSTVYMETALPLIQYIRQELPNTFISVVAKRCFVGQKNCAFNEGIVKYKNKFDGVIIHDYTCKNSSVAGLSQNDTVSFLSIYGQSIVPQWVDYVKQTFGTDKKLWITEFNMGLDEDFNATMDYSVIHAMFAWSYITQSICLSDTMELLMLHMISAQQGLNWSNDQVLMTNSAIANDINGATFDIMGQVYSHINYVSMIKNNKMFCLKNDMTLCPILNLEVENKNNLPCIHGTGFTNHENVNSFGFVLINSCSMEIEIKYEFSAMTILTKSVDLDYWVYVWDQYGKSAKFVNCKEGQQLW